MAEKNNPLFDVEVAVAHGWILEFLCHMAWIHFSSLDDSFYTCRDFLQNLLAGKVESTPERQKRIKLIQLLSRLADGKDYTTRYEEDGDITALESALPIFDSLVSDFAVPEDQVSEARGLVMTQSVLVCCRGGDFQAAEQVFSRVWLPGAVKSAKGKKLRSKVQEVMRSGNPEHSLVQVRCSYDKFLTWMIQFLRLIVDGFSLPFLLKAAQRVLRARIDAGEGTEAPEESLSQSESDSDMYETPSENEAPPKEQEEEFVFKSPALLRECFLVMAKEERSGSEWTDVAGYDYRSLRGDLAKSREAKTSGAASEKDLEQNCEEKTSGSGVRKSPRKHQQAAKNSEPTERRLSPRKKTSSETTGRHEFATHGAVQSRGEKRKRQTDEENFEKTENRKKTQTMSGPSTDRNNPGRTQKSGDTGKDIRYWMTSDQPSTSGVRKKVHKQAERRTLEESDSESEEEPWKENVTQGSKKRPRDRPEYGNGVKETWSSDEETFKAPVKKKYYIYDSDSDSSEAFPSALPCSAASLVVPRLVQKREPLDITSKGQVRSRFKWAEYEVENLIKGVQEYGVGHWSEILDNYRFKNRTNVNLKDKWRQLVKSGTVREFP
ncbi:uncharacterized protein LOC144906376 [Branchiostoma floridae x Branchiostoma belcheri]